MKPRYDNPADRRARRLRNRARRVLHSKVRRRRKHGRQVAT